MNHAAAVLVIDGPRVLAYSRYESEGLSLPCGNVRRSESVIEAALRVAQKETGLHLVLTPDVEPFIGFDNVGNALVHTYLATVSADDPGELMAETNGHGAPLWASLREISRGPYWHYNQRALRHFGVKPPLAGKFHSHMTIEAKSRAEAERAAQLIAGKLTVIDLSRDGRSQTDYMITHHYVTGRRGLEDQTDIEALLRSRGSYLREIGVGVTRLKLEYDVTHGSNRQDDAAAACEGGIYTEVHVKCVVSESLLAALTHDAAERGWHPSRNPFAKRDDGLLVQFVNRRFYGSASLPDIDAAVDLLVPSLLTRCAVEEIKYETAVYDTNDAHDKWWMEEKK